ncbi:hypothetical protein SAMN05216345_10355 [Cupriavidus sp. YR651]|uniref:hypothetical protein n=1 Tax=Cupriavidus sp. YR651 TaxID=1855315 RepID=UPI0008808926|nr:hypothetical protein [Cupriavidus sp. YR651]SDC62618.1 hypothetical protein SAMN05216345_10355 [Cupriavidus sp. YR651]
MPVWNVDSVDAEPEIELRHWSVYETERGERHFVGQAADSATGRVSSAIQKFDRTSRVGVTRSGRRYVLQGEPGFDPDAMHVWNVWSMVNAVIEAKNVTAEYLAQDESGCNDFAGPQMGSGPCPN